MVTNAWTPLEIIFGLTVIVAFLWVAYISLTMDS